MCTFFDDFEENHLSEGDGSRLTKKMQIKQTWNLKRKIDRNWKTNQNKCESVNDLIQ